MSENLVEIGRKVVRYAKKLGADEAEAYVTTLKLTKVKCSKRNDISIRSGTITGIGIRVFVKKSVGFSSISSLSPKQVNYATKKAIKSAKVTTPDRFWVSLPYPQKSIKRQFYNQDDKMDFSEILEILDQKTKKLEKASKIRKSLKHYTMQMENVINSTCICNTNDVEAFDRGTSTKFSFLVTVKNACQEATDSDFIISRSAKKTMQNMDETISNTIDLALKYLKAKKLKKVNVSPVILKNRIVAWFLLKLFVPNILASNLNNSIHKNRIGETIASQHLDIIDDGLYKDGLYSGRFDAEGTPRQTTPVVQKGVLRHFLYDNYWSKKERVKNTGNATRGISSYPFTTPPFIWPSNLILKSTQKSYKRLTEEVDQGVFLSGSLVGEGYADPLSGNFFVTCTGGFRIENGEITHPLAQFYCQGNFHEMLKKISIVGDDMRNFGRVICPSVYAEKLRLLPK